MFEDGRMTRRKVYFVYRAMKQAQGSCFRDALLTFLND
jgi:hypothetical protein